MIAYHRVDKQRYGHASADTMNQSASRIPHIITHIKQHHQATPSIAPLTMPSIAPSTAPLIAPSCNSDLHVAAAGSEERRVEAPLVVSRQKDDRSAGVAHLHVTGVTGVTNVTRVYRM